MMPLKPLPLQAYRSYSSEEDDDLQGYLMGVADMGNPLSHSCEQPGTPRAQSLGVPSSAPTFGSLPHENVFSSASTTSTAPTIYEDLEDQYSIVKDTAFENPFAPRRVRVVEDDFDSELDDYSPTYDIDMIGHDYQQDNLQQDDSCYHNSPLGENQLSDVVSEFSLIDEAEAGRAVQQEAKSPPKNVFRKNTIFVGKPKVFKEAADGDDETSSDEDDDENEADEDVDEADEDVDEWPVGDDADAVMTDADQEEGLAERRPSAADSVWDNYDVVSRQLHEYDLTKQRIKGHESWTEDQAKLHKLLSLRGVWPMFERTWTFHFKDREIYPWVYAPEDTTKRVAITAKSNDFRGELSSGTRILLQLLIPASSCQSSRVPI
jgi:hypothetical protein